MRRVHMCRFAARWPAYLEGTLPPDEKIAFAEHIGTCSSCLDRVNELHPTNRRTHETSDETPPGGAPDTEDRSR